MSRRKKSGPCTAALGRPGVNVALYWLLVVIMALGAAVAPLANAGTAGSQVPTPATVLDLSIVKANLTLSQAGQVKEAPGQLEIKNRQYLGAGAYPVTINGSAVVASQLAVTSELKFKGDTGEYKGTLDMDVSTAPGGRITLELRGTATREIDPVDGDIEVVAGGSFKTKNAAGLYAGLIANGTFTTKINERDGQPGAKVTITLATTSAASPAISAAPSPSAAVGGPFVGVPGPGYPTGPMNMAVSGVQLATNQLGQVNEQGGQLEIKGRQYGATGFFPVSINDASLTANEIKVVSNLKLKGGTGQHQGAVDVEIAAPAGHVTLEYQGTATMTGSTIVSKGNFKTTRTTGAFAGLVAEGTYDMSIVELASGQGAPAMITILTRSIVAAAAAPPGAVSPAPVGGFAPGDPLVISMPDADLTIASLGTVTEGPGTLEIKDRLYDGGNGVPVSINGVTFAEYEIQVTSNMKLIAGAGEYKGKVDIHVKGPPRGDLALELIGTITMRTDAGVTKYNSKGTYTVTKARGLFAGLVAQGNYEMELNEKGSVLGSKVDFAMATSSAGSAVALASPAAAVTPQAVGGPFVGVPGPGYPTGPLNMNMAAAQLTVGTVWQAKAGSAGALEISNQQFNGAGAFPVTINGANLRVTQISVVSKLQTRGGTGPHRATIDVDIDTVPASHVTIEHQGTAQISGSQVVSTGKFKTIKTTGAFAGLVAEGNSSLTIVQTLIDAGSPVTVNLTTTSSAPAAQPAATSPAAPQPTTTTGGLVVSISGVELSTDKMWEATAGKPGDLVISNRQYEGTGSLPVTINGVASLASQIKIISNLRAKGGSGQHSGTIDIDVATTPSGHLTLQFQGKAKINGLQVVSNGKFKVVSATGNFAGLVADGAYNMTIVQSGAGEGLPATVTLSLSR